MTDTVYIVFDIGGTKMRIAAAGEDGLEEVHKVPTPLDPKEGIAELVRIAKEAAHGRAIAAVAGCTRWILADGVFLAGDDILTRWGKTRLVDEISSALGSPVRIVHDTAAAGLGEVHHGAGRGSKICAYITVSTGVGGDRIVDGAIDRSTFNPEIGRQLVDGVELGDLVSGTAVQKKYGVEPKDLESLEEREKLADTLATGLYNTVMHWSPDTIVLGGSMIIGLNPIPLVRIKESLAKLLIRYPKMPSLKMTELGDDGGLTGAAILAQEITRGKGA